MVCQGCCQCDNSCTGGTTVGTTTVGTTTVGTTTVGTTTVGTTVGTAEGTPTAPPTPTCGARCQCIAAGGIWRLAGCI